MRRRPAKSLARVSTCLLASAGPWACDADLPPPTEGPEKQFTARDVRIEERLGDAVLWSGHAARAEGDLAAADVFDLVIERHPQDAREPVLTIRAPRGNLALAEGHADFESARIVDDAGAQLDVGTAHYDEGKKEVTATGPLRFASRELVASGSRAVIRLDARTVEIVGPIVGRFTPPRK